MLPRDFREKAAKQAYPYSGKLAIIDIIVVALNIAMFLIGLIPYYVGPFLFLIALILVQPPLTMSYADVCHKVNDNKPLLVSNAFYGFTRFGKSFVLQLLTGIFVFLWSLLLLVPGFIKSYSYSQAIYIAHKNPEKGSLACITESKLMMKGHKFQLFLLDLSFVGWHLLSILTLGLLELWIAPKHRQARYIFHINLINNRIESK